jgi:hypothetical protein
MSESWRDKYPESNEYHPSETVKGLEIKRKRDHDDLLNAIKETGAIIHPPMYVCECGLEFPDKKELEIHYMHTGHNSNLQNTIPETPLAKQLRNRLSLGMCRQDGKFYPNQSDLRLIANVEKLEKAILSFQTLLDEPIKTKRVSRPNTTWVAMYDYPVDIKWLNDWRTKIKAVLSDIAKEMKK